MISNLKIIWYNGWIDQMIWHELMSFWLILVWLVRIQKVELQFSPVHLTESRMFRCQDKCFRYIFTWSCLSIYDATKIVIFEVFVYSNHIFYRYRLQKIYFSRDGICIFFSKIRTFQNQNTFSFPRCFVRIFIRCSFFEMPNFLMFDYFVLMFRFIQIPIYFHLVMFFYLWCYQKSHFWSFCLFQSHLLQITWRLQFWIKTISSALFTSWIMSHDEDQKVIENRISANNFS